ncbi:MAG: putative small secreted protein [Alphaproteobacteria bacterium]|jgi:predicted small secreted protein
MKYLIALSITLTATLLCGCNTIGGLGQDVSEAGRALDNAAYWSQSQIHTLNTEMTTDGSTMNNTYNTPLSIEDANTARQY